jgi:hypothetical protein
MKQLPKVYVDQGVNLKKLRTLQAQGLVTLLQANSIEQQFKGVSKQGKAFTIEESVIGGLDMIAGDNIGDIGAEIGRQHKNDFNHIYAAYLNKCDYFVTENPRDFINNGKRESLEQKLNIKIRRTDEFLANFKRNSKSRL